MYKKKSNKLRAIAFDVGGVMTENGFNDLYEIIKEIIPISQDKFDKIFISSDRADSLRKNESTLAEYWKYVRESIQVDYQCDIYSYYDEKELTKLLYSGFKPRAYIKEIINKLKSNGYIIAIMSNEFCEKRDYLEDLLVYDGIDVKILSCDIGLTKPHSSFFKKSLEILGLPCNEVLFIDDRKDNIKTASSLGFETLWFNNKNILENTLMGKL